MTKYRVFRKESVGENGLEVWLDQGVFEGRDPQNAIEAAIVANDKPSTVGAMTHAATPASSWKELTPSGVDIETKVRFG